MWRSTTYLEIVEQLASYFAMPHNTNRTYEVGELCLRGTQVYEATNSTIGIFSSNNWQVASGNNAKILRWTDVYNSQFDYQETPSKELAFAFPCIFVEFHTTEWQSQLNNEQKGDCLIRIHIGKEKYSGSYDLSKQKADKLEHLDFLDHVHACLQNLQGLYFSKLNRTREELDLNHSNVIHHIFEYNTMITDCSVTELLPPETVNIDTVHVNPDYDDANNGEPFIRIATQKSLIVVNNPKPTINDNPYSM